MAAEGHLTHLFFLLGAGTRAQADSCRPGAAGTGESCCGGPGEEGDRRTASSHEAMAATRVATSCADVPPPPARHASETREPKQGLSPVPGTWPAPLAFG